MTQKIENKNVDFNEFIGWFTALLFPFAARGLLDITRIPIISSSIYYLVFGIFIRIKLDGHLPYFKPQFIKVKWETAGFFLSAVLSSFLYLNGVNPISLPATSMAANLIVFALINGSFEHLVWANIYELAGSRHKYMGVAAATIYVSLIHALFWGRFIPSPHGGSSIFFILSQLLVLWIPLRIYVKTKDLTIWSIQHILYNMLAVVIGGFGIGLYLHF